jgi:hypothetical protein
MIQINFPERNAPARYTVREDEARVDGWDGLAAYQVHRTLGSVYHRFKGGYEQEITQNGRTHTIGRSPSLMAAITALRRFHELTGYAYAPWEELE